VKQITRNDRYCLLASALSMASRANQEREYALSAYHRADAGGATMTIAGTCLSLVITKTVLKVGGHDRSMVVLVRKSNGIVRLQ